jgi:dethiobiotin synthetase
LTIEALQNRKIAVAGIVFSGDEKTKPRKENNFE